MRALVLEHFNSPFTLVELPRPSPGPRDALVRIMASGVNPLDTKIRAGKGDHAMLESGNANGKLVVNVAEEAT
jgi:NADPH2:quinone reductase